MTTSAFSMSGIYSLASPQVELFESLGIDVPKTMNADQLRNLIELAVKTANQDPHPVLTPMFLSVMADIAALLPQAEPSEKSKSIQ